MTIEEAKDYIREWCPYDRQEEIIKALEQEPCGDCISRETARRIVDSGRTRQQMIDMILATPPVTSHSKTGKRG